MLTIKSKLISDVYTVINDTKAKGFIYITISQKENIQIFPNPTSEKTPEQERRGRTKCHFQFLWFSYNSIRETGKSQILNSIPH